jgi:hypothetical protein
MSRLVLVSAFVIAAITVVHHSPPALEEDVATCSSSGQLMGVATSCGSPVPGLQLANIAYIDGAVLKRWLERAYSSSDGRAGFGDYPAENLDLPSLQQTWAAISILRASSSIAHSPDLPLTLEWVGSLRLPDGLYDDPVTQAPVLLETLWALSILDALDSEPGDRKVTLATLLDGARRCTQQANSANHEAVVGQLSDLSLIMSSIALIEGSAFLTSDPSLAEVRDGILDLLSAFPAVDASPWSVSAESSEEWLLALLGARLSGEQTSEAIRDALSRYIETIPNCASGAAAEQQLLTLVEVSRMVFGWADLPAWVLARIRAYIDKTARLMPPSGAYGWSFEGWSWVDPALNNSRARLYMLVGEENPGREVLAQAIACLKCPTGWSTLIEAIPSIDFTYFGTRIALASGACSVDYSGVKAFARSVLADAQATSQDLLYGVRTLLALGCYSANDRAGVAARIAAIDEDAVKAETYWLAPLLAAARIVPVEETSLALRSASREFFPALAAPQIGSLRLLTQLNLLLGESSGTSLDDILRAAHVLAVPGQGFRWSMTAPFPELASVYCATELFAAAGRLSDLEVDVLREFVRSCWEAPGFSLARPSDIPSAEDSYIDLFTTYMGVQILSLLDEYSP